MANIDIERPHTMGMSRARAVVDNFAAGLHERFGVNHHWQGDVLQFSGSGVSGAISISTSAIRVTAQLSLLLSPLRGKIEQDIRAKLDQHLS
ncbi:MAG: polyhydroxyalkanoic acid system family protein [Rhodanobacter sp.]